MTVLNWWRHDFPDESRELLVGNLGVWNVTVSRIGYTFTLLVILKSEVSVLGLTEYKARSCRYHASRGIYSMAWIFGRRNIWSRIHRFDVYLNPLNDEFVSSGGIRHSEEWSLVWTGWRQNPCQLLSNSSFSWSFLGKRPLKRYLAVSEEGLLCSPASPGFKMCYYFCTGRSTSCFRKGPPSIWNISYRNTNKTSDNFFRKQNLLPSLSRGRCFSVTNKFPKDIEQMRESRMNRKRGKLYKF